MNGDHRPRLAIPSDLEEGAFRMLGTQGGYIVKWTGGATTFFVGTLVPVMDEKTSGC